MGTCKLRMLGTPEVYNQNEKVFFPFAKAEGLFYYLAMKKKASGDDLAALLWGESDDVSAKKNLEKRGLFVEETVWQRLFVDANPQYCYT